MKPLPPHEEELLLEGLHSDWLDELEEEQLTDVEEEVVELG
jgi:hypothetical protein